MYCNLSVILEPTNICNSMVPADKYTENLLSVCVFILLLLFDICQKCYMSTMYQNGIKIKLILNYNESGVTYINMLE